MPEIHINEGYRPLAVDLLKRFPNELKHVKLDEILFVDSDGGGTGAKAKFGEVKQIPDLVSRVIEEKYGRWIRYIVVFFKNNCMLLSREQRVLMMYHQLRHIGEDGLIKHDVEEFGNIAATIGADWASTKRKIPDILAIGFDWAKIEGPQLRMTLPDGTATVAIIKGGQAARATH